MGDFKTLKDLTLIYPFTEKTLRKVKDILEPRLVLIESTSTAIIQVIRALAEASQSGNLDIIDMAHGVDIQLRQELTSDSILQSLASVCPLPDIKTPKLSKDRCSSKQESRTRQREYRHRNKFNNFKQ